jgi:hypothetical protein
MILEDEEEKEVLQIENGCIINGIPHRNCPECHVLLPIKEPGDLCDECKLKHRKRKGWKQLDSVLNKWGG